MSAHRDLSFATSLLEYIRTSKLPAYKLAEQLRIRLAQARKLIELAESAGSAASLAEKAQAILTPPRRRR